MTFAKRSDFVDDFGGAEATSSMTFAERSYFVDNFGGAEATSSIAFAKRSDFVDERIKDKIYGIYKTYMGGEA